MRQVLYIIFAISILLVSILFFTYFKISTEYEEQASQKMAIVIYLGEHIEKLQQIKLTACDSTYVYDTPALRDTIWDDIAINNQTFPCPVEISYLLKDHSTKHIQVDSFNCGGCSGSNFYQLTSDEVLYYYHP